MVYDITKKETFENLQSWLKDLRSYAEEDVGILLIGNKVDLEDQRQVANEEATQWAEELKVDFIETSAKNAVNVDDAFSKLVSQLFNLKFEEKLLQKKDTDTIVLQDKPKKKKLCLIL